MSVEIAQYTYDQIAGVRDSYAASGASHRANVTSETAAAEAAEQVADDLTAVLADITTSAP